jgi:Ca-activated chloride channel family protein
MNAADVTPSRLARARFEVLDLLAASREGQVALIAFGPEPYIVSPLTGDARTIADQVPRLGTDLLPVPGLRRTGRALAMAGELLAQAGAAGGEVILITDAVADATGPSSGPGAGSTAAAAARDLAARGHRLSVLGVGTPEGAPVPGQDGGFVSDRAGAIPMARLDQVALEALAREGQGRYVDLNPGDRDTSALIASTETFMAAANRAGLVEQEGLKSDQWREEGPWLLLALLPIAALAFRRGWLLSVLVLVLGLPPQPGWAFGWGDLWQRPDQQGASRLAAGEADAAAALFQDPAWRAAARYRGGDYAGALTDLSDQNGPEADYNRANALARLGRLDESIAAYERTLQQAPDHADARANLELVRRLRDQQHQAQNQGAQQQGDQDQGAQNQENKDQKGQQGQPDGQKGQSTGAGQDQPGNDPQGEAGKSGSEPRGKQGTAGQGAPKGSDPGGQSPGTAGQQAEKEGKNPPGTQDAPAQGTAAGHTGGTAAPKAADLGANALQGEPEVTLPEPDKPGAGKDQGQARVAADRTPGGTPPTGAAIQQRAGADDLNPQQREQQQAIEAQLRRVPDDPAGLLRQRFLLQQLRREGRLP